MDKKKKLTTRKEWEELLEKENVASKAAFGILSYIGALLNGAHKEKVWKWLGKKKEERTKFNECWLNLEKNGFFENGKVTVSKDFGRLSNGSVEFVLAGLCAEGLVERTTKKGGLRRNEEKRS